MVANLDGIAPWITPFTDVEPVVADAQPIDPQGMKLRVLMRALRDDVAYKATRGISWQAVIDAFRPAVSSLWTAMPDADRRRFLRHLRSLWLVHRHRMAPDVAELLAKLKRESRLSAYRTLAGSDATKRGYNVTLQPRGHKAPTTSRRIGSSIVPGRRKTISVSTMS